ncbi:MAG: carboxypeptidase-like regulatory domain-containing protein [Candidatus Rokuibacteriota bacterium]
MRRRAALAAALCAALVVGACQRAPEAPAPGATIVDAAAEARKALAAGDCAAAAPHLRAAIAKDPESLYLHYNLGVCASHLNARDETIREFQWVVAHADPKSPEAEIARRWLIDAGVLTGGSTAATSDPTVGDSVLRGVVTWSEGGAAPSPRSRQQLFLQGLRGTPNQALQYVRRSDESGIYAFKNVPAGTYKLTDVIAGKPKWRLKVVVEPGQETAIDLSPENGLPTRDDFPQDG